MTARPLVTVYDERGKATDIQAKLPGVFRAPIRPDIIGFVHDQMRKNKRQPYAVAAEAGESLSLLTVRNDLCQDSGWKTSPD